MSSGCDGLNPQPKAEGVSRRRVEVLVKFAWPVRRTISYCRLVADIAKPRLGFTFSFYGFKKHFEGSNPKLLLAIERAI